MNRHRKYFCLSLVIAVTAAMIPLPSTAAGNELVINEIYTRGGNTNQPYRRKYVELYNPGDAAFSLSGLGLSYSSASSTDNGVTCSLDGSVPAKGYFLVGVGGNGATGAPLEVDRTCSGLNPSGTAGAFALISGGRTIDLVGWGSAKRFEGAPAAYPGSNSTVGSISRTSGADSDNNRADFSFSATPTPQRATDTPVPAPITAAIAEIQGEGESSPLAGREVTTTGVVTAAYPGGGFDGVYIQTPGSGKYPKAAGQASDGIFVYSKAASERFRAGDCLQVSGTAEEFHGLTQIVGREVAVLSSCAPVSAISLAGLPASDKEKEAYEGMLVMPSGAYTITDNYELNSRGKLGLAAGTAPLRQATDVVSPGVAAKEYEKKNLARLITLDDGSSWDYLRNTTAQNSPLPYLAKDRPLRAGSAVTFTKPVILDFRFQWNFQPTAQIIGSDSAADPVQVTDNREQRPQLNGIASIASFNVLNYFTDLGKDEEGCAAFKDRQGNPVTTNRCQVRGAWSQAAFADQSAKVVSAINLLDTDVVALMEVENPVGVSWAVHDRDATLRQLVDSLNSAAGRQRWAYAPSPQMSSVSNDVIRTAFIYNPDTVQLAGASEILTDQAFASARQPLAQKFRLRSNGDAFVVVANHFKSKGSGEDDGTGQGLANPSREAQAKALTAWVSKAFEWQPVFLVGDFNSYTRETPLQIIEKAGYKNVVRRFSPESASYQYGGRIGSLDHVFANSRAMRMVTGAEVWDINGDESSAFEYSRRNYNVVDFYTPSPFRSSDHDPVIVGLQAQRQS